MENKLPKNWVECSIGEIVSSKRGKKPSSTIDHQKEGYIPYILIDEMEGKSIRSYTNDPKVSIVDEKDVLIVWDGSIGKCGSGLNGAIGSTLVALTPQLEIPTKFIEYFIINQNSFIKQTSTGTGLQHINKEFFNICRLNLPPLAEQNRVVDKLDALFAQHEAIKTSMAKIPGLLKNFRQQVLTQAVTGKLTEEWRKGKELEETDENIVNITLKKENEILNQIHLKEGRSKIKLNPIFFISKSTFNWTTYTIESLCLAIVDCLHETATFTNDGYKLIDTNNIVPFKINSKKLRYVNNEVYKKWVSRLKPEYGDIAFTREGTIGNVVMIPENDKYCIGQRTMLFRFSKLMNKKFCELFMNSEFFKDQFKPHIKGVASQHVNIRDLRLLRISVPPIEEQQEIVNRVESLFTKADAIEQQYKNLKAKIDTLPQAILHKAFKGELTEQLDSDGDAKELLSEIMKLKQVKQDKKKPKATKVVAKKAKLYPENDEVLGKIAED